MNIIKFSTKTDVNGNTYGLAVDIEKKEICTEFLTHKTDIKLTKRDLNKLSNFLTENGYTNTIHIKRG